MAISDYYLTPDIGASKDTMKRKMAYALLMQGTSGEPIKHWTQALARAAQGAFGGYGLYAADQADREREAKVAGSIDTLPGMSPAAPVSESVSPRIASALTQSIPYGGNTVPTNTGDTIPLPPRNPLGGLNPEFRSKFADLRSAAADKGVAFNAPEAGSLGNVRTPEQQASIYAQGRTAPGPVVTQTLNSNHLTGNALDVVPQNGASHEMVGKTVNALIQSDPRFASLRSGASFKTLPDPLHVEQPNGQPQPYQIAQAGGGPIPVPQARGPVLTPQQAAEIRTLWQDPATRPLAMQKYQQYSTPKDQEVPLTTTQERSAAGIPASDQSPYQRNSVTGKITSINNRPQINVSNQAESSFEKTYGESMGKRATSVIESGDKAVGDFQKVQLLRGLLSNIQQGKLTPAQATVGGWLQSVGIDPKIIGTDASLPATAEAATSLINKFALSNIGAQEGGIPANNFSEADRDFILRLVPNLKNRPEANDIILTAKEREAQLSIERADKWAEARANGISYEKFERGWRKEMSTKNIFGDLTEKVKALSAPGYSPSMTPQGGGGSAPNIDELLKKYGK